MRSSTIRVSTSVAVRVGNVCGREAGPIAIDYQVWLQPHGPDYRLEIHTAHDRTSADVRSSIKLIDPSVERIVASSRSHSAIRSSRKDPVSIRVAAVCDAGPALIAATTMSRFVSHRRYNVAFDAWARRVTASKLKRSYPYSPRSSSTHARISASRD